MSMTDKQFQSWLRFLLKALKEATNEPDSDKKDTKLVEIMDNLQTLVD